MQAVMADLDAKVRAFLLDAQLEDSTGHHTFAQRAESYYQKRPHLLSLLRHLHSAYLCLLHSSHHSKQQQQQHLITLHRHRLDDVEDDNFTSDDGAESTLSTVSSSTSITTSNHYPYPYPYPSFQINTHHKINSGDQSSVGSLDQIETNLNPGVVVDTVVAEMVIKEVEFELMVHELGVNRARAESSLRRCELQGSLVEVLESERRVLASENAKLRWRAAALAEEGEALAAESAFLRRRVGELTGTLRRVKKEEGRMVVVLTRKVEELRKQIYGMEKWNRVMVGKVGEEMGGMCEKCREREDGCSGGEKVGEKVAKWWEKVRGIQEFFLCGGPNCSAGGAKTGGGGV